MERELAAAGIDADIRLVATTAEHAGKWTCVFFATSSVDRSRQPDDPPQMPAARNDIRFTSEALFFRPGFAERLVIVAGRAAEAGEQPTVHPEVCASGEPGAAVAYPASSKTSRHGSQLLGRSQRP
jgi:hypothetical protein